MTHPDRSRVLDLFRLAAITPLTALVVIAVGASRGTAAAQPLRTVADVPLPGPAVRFDYQSLDTAANRLYIAHMNADRLVVVDLRTRTVVADLPAFDRVHGVLSVPTTGRVYASVTGRKQVAVVDARTLAVVARVGEIQYPNGLAYAPNVDRIFVSDNSGTDAVIDAKTNRLVASIPLGAGAGNTVYDPGSQHVLVATHGRNELLTIDAASATVIARSPLPGVGNAHGVVLDADHRLAFVAGTENAMLAVVDLRTMKVIHAYKVPESPDVLAFDPAWGRLYVSSESGGVSVFTEMVVANDVTLSRDGDMVIPHAHTVSVDPRTHLVYFPLENVNGRPVLRIMAADPPARLRR